MAQGKLKGRATTIINGTHPFLSLFEVLLTRIMSHQLHGKTSPLFFAPHPSLPHPENLNLNHKVSLYIKVSLYLLYQIQLSYTLPWALLFPICNIILLKLLAMCSTRTQADWLLSLFTVTMTCETPMVPGTYHIRVKYLSNKWLKEITPNRAG